MSQRVKVYVSTWYTYVPKHSSSALEDENPGMGRFKWKTAARQAAPKGKRKGK